MVICGVYFATAVSENWLKLIIIRNQYVRKDSIKHVPVDINVALSNTMM